jgi:DUF971 family protein
MSTKPKPTDIVLHQQSHSLEIAFDDGARFDMPCELLRVYSPSAEVSGHWGQHAKLQVDKQDVNITEIRPVGAYAVKIFFDDGHNSGTVRLEFSVRSRPPPSTCTGTTICNASPRPGTNASRPAGKRDQTTPNSRQEAACARIAG